jgi:hypothetical protein
MENLLTPIPEGVAQKISQGTLTLTGEKDVLTAWLLGHDLEALKPEWKAQGLTRVEFLYRTTLHLIDPIELR